MKQVSNQEVYQNRSDKTRVSRLTLRDVAHIAGEIQRARMILDKLSLSELAKLAGTSKQNLQQTFNRDQAEKGESK